MATWPPLVEELQLDMKISEVTLTPEQLAQLEQVLAAAIAYVERVRTDLDYTGPVGDDLILGTLRYARRLDLRRESPVGMIVVDGMTSANIPGWDADIEKNLEVGRYSRMKFA